MFLQSAWFCYDFNFDYNSFDIVPSVSFFNFIILDFSVFYCTDEGLIFVHIELGSPENKVALATKTKWVFSNLNNVDLFIQH